MTIKELNWDQFADFVSRKDVKCSNYDVYQVSVTRDHSQLTVLLNYSDDDMKTFAQQVVPVVSNAFRLGPLSGPGEIDVVGSMGQRVSPMPFGWVRYRDPVR